jgi:cyanate lyase
MAAFFRRGIVEGGNAIGPGARIASNPAYSGGVMTRDDLRRLALDSKDRLGLTWPQLGAAIGRSPVYAAMLVYGYGQATEDESLGLARILALPADALAVLQKAPHRVPAQPWPPTDPFIYRLYEAIMLYGPAFKDVAHELFGDGIMSAIDMSVDIRKVEDPPGVPRMVLTMNGKWLQYMTWLTLQFAGPTKGLA